MLIVLNHKMNLNIKEIKVYEESLRPYSVIVMPQTPYMGLFTSGDYILGSQCVSEYNATGGISTLALSGLNVKYVLVGHYERRSINKDTKEVILKKVQELLNNDMLPILCIGESLEERNNNIYKEVLFNEIDYIYSNVDNKKENIIIGYEPIWNIASNNDINIKEIETTINEIKTHIKETYLIQAKVLYGGGVNYNNSLKLKEIKNLDGLIIGTASQDINNVKKIYNTFH